MNILSNDRQILEEMKDFALGDQEGTKSYQIRTLARVLSQVIEHIERKEEDESFSHLEQSERN